jgi:hypothetical protein
MLQLDKYSAIEDLHDGRRVEVRSLRPDDRTDFLAAVARASSESLRRRFFAIKHSFTDQKSPSF